MMINLANKIRVYSYGKYSTDNYGVNTLCLEIGSLTLYFSYDTIVAFGHPEYGLVVCENVFSPTTGKHLNWIDGGNRKNRVPYEKFKEMLDEVLRKTLPGIFESEEEKLRRKMMEDLKKVEEELNRIWVERLTVLQL